MKTEISFEESDRQGTGLGLIGPGNGRLIKAIRNTIRVVENVSITSRCQDVAQNLIFVISYYVYSRLLIIVFPNKWCLFLQAVFSGKPC